MQAAIDRIIRTYGLLTSRNVATETLAAMENYVKMLFDAGETDPERLTVYGLVYLRERDGGADPVRAGYTGL